VKTVASDNAQSDDEKITQHTKKFQRELNSGTVSLVLLSILYQAKIPLYGYQISKLLQQGNEGKQGAIYPVLRNLHARSLIHCDIKLSEDGPPRKYYTITPLGKKVHKQWLLSWESTQTSVNNIIGGSLNHEE
jgi:PadR family transcriptional regulator PadR